MAHFAASGIHPEALEGELAHGEPRPYCSRTAAAVRRGFQRAALAALPTGVQSRMEWRIRHKLKVWNVSQFPRCRAERCLAVLRELGARVSPRTWSAVWRGAPCGTDGCHIDACKVDAASRTNAYSAVLLPRIPSSTTRHARPCGGLRRPRWGSTVQSHAKIVRVASCCWTSRSAA